MFHDLLVLATRMTWDLPLMDELLWRRFSGKWYKDIHPDPSIFVLENERKYKACSITFQFISNLAMVLQDSATYLPPSVHSMHWIPLVVSFEIHGYMIHIYIYTYIIYGWACLHTWHTPQINWFILVYPHFPDMDTPQFRIFYSADTCISSLHVHGSSQVFPKSPAHYWVRHICIIR